MKIKKTTATVMYALTLATGFVVTHYAVAADAVTAPASDMRKLSEQGNKAFRDIALARLAIFNGNPKLAKQLVKDAQAALKKAKADGTSYMKAEAQLKTSATADQPASATGTASIAWLPVEGDIVLADDYVRTPEKAAAVAKANAHLKNGEREKALDVLRLAGVDVSYTLAVVPLERTVEALDKADGLLTIDLYYEANEILRHAQDNVRIDTVTFSATPMRTNKPATGTQSK